MPKPTNNLAESYSPAVTRARNKLIMTAINLYADRGANSVSLREINRETGSKNHSALHHYFGSKIGLISAVNNFIQSAFDEKRQDELNAIEASAKQGDISLRRVLETFIRPYVTIMSSETWGPNAIRTLARFEFDNDEQIKGLLHASSAGTAKRFQRLVHQCLPQLPKKLLDHRLNFCVNSVISGFAENRNLSETYLGDLSLKDTAKLGELYLDMIQASLSAPQGGK